MIGADATLDNTPPLLKLNMTSRQQRRPPARDRGNGAHGYDQAGYDQADHDQADHDQAVWRRLCGEIGIAGLAVPECYGGAGAGPVETHIAAEELGRDLTPTPLLGSVVLAAQALLASGDAAACRRLLPGIACVSSRALPMPVAR